MKLHNPVIPGFSPDPSICRVGEDYYLAVSSFEYFPAIPIWHSRDLVHWRQIGHAVHRPEQMPFEPWVSCGMLAPTLRHHAGRFYLTCTNAGGGGNFIVHAADPAGPWSDPVWIDQPGIDPSLFVDDDGSVYYTNSYRFTDDRGMRRCTIGQSRIELQTGAILEPVREIWPGTGGKGAEAPHLYKIDGRYYLMIAEGGTEYGHMGTIARSHSPWGPWESCPDNPIFSNRSTDLPLQACGHGDLVQAPDGSWWMVFLAIRPVGYHSHHVLGRETCLAPVRWTDAGWPVVGTDGRLPLSFEAALPHPLQALPPKPVRDDFDSQTLDLEWNHLRLPRSACYSLDHRPGHLTLWGTASDIDNMFRPTWIGRRQRHLRCRVATCLDFAPGEGQDQEHEKEEAGLCVWQNPKHHYEIALQRRHQRNDLLLRRRIGSLVAEECRLPWHHERVYLEVTADPVWYRFRFSADGEHWQHAGAGEIRYLSTEVAGLFTGVFFALYATGHGKPSTTPACFDWFEYAEDADV